MHVLAVSASPRRNGNSEFLLARLIEGMVEAGARVEVVRTHDLDIAPCSGCGGCLLTGECVVRDDFTGLAATLRICDGLVFASPLYFMNVPARGKAFIDRLQSFWIAKHRLGLDLFGGRRRYGMLAACSGQRSGPGGADVFRGIEDTMTYVFDALGLVGCGSLLVRGVEETGDASALPGLAEQARERGKGFIRSG